MPTVSTAPKKIDVNDPRLREMQRDAVFMPETANEEERTVELSFASETPVERYFGNEILDCGEGSCDLSRLNDGAPLLVNHDVNQWPGVIESARMDKDRKGRSLVRFAKDEEGEKYFGRVRDKIIRKVSVGYRVQDMVLEGERDGLETYRVTRWQPYEVSLVSLPADNSVGVGRSATEQVRKPIITMPEANTPPAEIQEAVNRASGLEASRCAEILAISDQFKVPAEKRNQAIANKTSLEAFRKMVMEEVINSKPIESSPDIGMNTKERKRYSLLGAMNKLANGQSLRGTLEGEASDAAAKLYKRETQGLGFIVPHDMSTFADKETTLALMRVSPSFNKRALEASTFTGAGAFVQTDVLGGSLIELLRNKTLLNQLGTINMTGLQGNIAIPKQTAAATAYWLDEAGTVTRTQQSVSQLGLTPKRLSAGTAYTKQFLAQSSIDPEAFVRNDLMQVLAIAKDLAGIAGTGGAQPLGIINTPNINTVTFSTTATLAKVLEFETAIMSDNADIGAMNWLTNITVRNKWKTVAQLGSTFPIFLCGPDNKANNYAMNVTNQVPPAATAPFAVANQVIFGAFNQAIMADWAGMDIVVDPYTLALQNQVAITVCVLTDFGVRHAESFAVSTDSGAQ
jgi:HK97 family phage major capsid protein/HK97 family phage prohead protease